MTGRPAASRSVADPGSVTTEASPARRYVVEVSLSGPLPNLVYVDRVIAVTEPESDEFAALYLDTANHRLARQSMTLCRVDGGADEGWWLDAGDDAGGPARIREPLGRSARPPAGLARRVRVLTRHETLRRVTTVRTTRVQRRLLDETGAVLGTVSDDVVRAQPARAHAPTSVWRQVSVTIHGDHQQLGPAVLDRLESAGLHPREAVPVPPRIFAGLLPPASATGPDTRSGDVLLAYLRRQETELIRGDARARRDEPDAVHRMRVATRRLRAALATYASLIDRSRTEPVRRELAWLGAVLGAPRDAEVVRDRLRRQVCALAPDLVRGAVPARIEQETAARHELAHAELVRALDSQRYLCLLDSLEELTVSPPLLDGAGHPARVGLVPVVRTACRRVDRLAARADAATDPEERVDLLHKVRRAAKRARYTAESVTPALGRRAARVASAMEQLQEVLGEYQDSLVAQPVLASMATAAHEAGEDSFTYGVLYGLEQGRAEAALARYPRVRDAARAHAGRRWLR